MTDIPFRADNPDRDRNSALLIYVLYLASWVVPFAHVAALIAAYVRLRGANAVWRTHFTYQIRTFWLFLLFLVMGVVLVLTGVIGGVRPVLLAAGIVLLVGIGFWWTIRCIVGLIKALDASPVPYPQSLLLGL